MGEATPSESPQSPSSPQSLADSDFQGGDSAEMAAELSARTAEPPPEKTLSDKGCGVRGGCGANPGVGPRVGTSPQDPYELAEREGIQRETELVDDGG